MAFRSIAIAVTTLVLATSVNASVFNTLNGINYEWLELTATQGLSRDQVNLRLSDPDDELYGYEYASRALVEDLLLSYSSWDGLDGLHGDSIVVEGLSQYINDFGALFTSSNYGPVTITSVDNQEVLVDGYVMSNSLYGTINECNGVEFSCVSDIVVLISNGLPSLAYQSGDLGYDSLSTSFVNQYNFISDPDFGSHLVRVSAVPIPAAIWLLGSGLIGLIGLAKRKN